MPPDEQDVSRLTAAYDRFFPRRMISLLGKESVTDVSLGDQVEMNLTVLFTDIRDFTTLSESLSPHETFRFVNSYLSRMEPLISSHRGVIDKFIGDAIMAIFPERADDAVDCALAMIAQLHEYNQGRLRAGYVPINVGIGLNTGLSMLGTVGGERRMDGTVISDAVNLASRLESATKQYGVKLLISENTYNNIHGIEKYDLRFIDRIMVKGKQEPQSVYEVFSGDDERTRDFKNQTRAQFEDALACYHYKYVDRAQDLLTQCLERNPQDWPARVYYDRCLAFKKDHVHSAARELGVQVAWDVSYAIGEGEIDEQHRALFEQTARLAAVLRKDHLQSETADMLEFLDSYVAKHFSSEERMMTAYDYPFLTHQQHQHQRFTRFFSRLKEDIRDTRYSKTYRLFRTQIFIVDWIVNHTIKEDGHFRKFYRNLRSGEHS